MTRTKNLEQKDRTRLHSKLGETSAGLVYVTGFNDSQSQDQYSTQGP